MSSLSQVQQILNYYGIYYEISPTNRMEWLYLCPFHDDHDIGSAMFNDVKGAYYCWSCGEGGGIVEFVAKLEDCSFSEASTLLNNDFRKAGTYDVETTQRIVNRRVMQGTTSAEYQKLAEGAVARLFQKCPSDVSSLQNAIILGTWMLSFKDENLSKKSKQVLQLYDEFYSTYIIEKES
jgi:DNA primase